MADEWIKMRSELWTHPRFVTLSNRLIYSKEFNVSFSRYVCGEDFAKSCAANGSNENNENVTASALQLVTKRALRDVAMCAILRVWCAVNAHCKVVESNAICSPMDLSDLDEIAGFDGFGEALKSVEWVECDEANNALIFRNFLEFNKPAALRKKDPMTNAERQARYREKQRNRAAKSNESNESNAREEKRREDIKTKEKNRKKKIEAPAIDLPDYIDPEAWAAYLDTRKAAKVATTEYAKKLLLAKARELHAQGHDVNASIADAITGSYKSLYPPKGNRNATNRQTSKTGNDDEFWESAERVLASSHRP